jgi:molybdopterin-guanine dinucleotide biosynthesis protein A
MGTDKAFIELEGVPVWRRQLRMMQQLEPTEIFISGPPHDEWKHADCVIIPDAESNAGPLAGLVAALRRCTTPLLLTLAIDLPNMTSDYLRGLMNSCAANVGALPAEADRYEPVSAVYPTRALHIAENCLASRELSLQRFAARCIAERLVNVKPIAPDERPLFLNMNTPEDVPAVTHA